MKTPVCVVSPFESQKDQPRIATDDSLLSSSEASSVSCELEPIKQARKIYKGCVFQIC